MQRAEQRALEWDCHQILARLFYYLDETRYDDLVALFSPDGVWHRQGKVLKGREEMMAAMRARPGTQVIRHVLTNVLVEAAGADAAEAVSYITTYVHDSGKAEPRPVSIRSPMRIFVAKTKFRRSAGRCEIVEHDLKPQFDFPKTG